MIRDLSVCIEFAFGGCEEEHTDFLTEAYDETGRRIDLVSLNNDTRFEFETDHSVDKKKEHNDDSTVNIYI